MRVSLGDTIHPRFFTHNASGAAADADALPTVNVKEDGGAAFTTGVTVTDDGVGEYYATIVCTSGNGYEQGKWYEVAAIATTGGVVSKQSICRFQVMATPAVEGIPLIDVDRWRGTQPATVTNVGGDNCIRVGVVGYGTFAIVFNAAQAGGNNTITLHAGASANNDHYLGQVIVLASGTQQAQARVITAYNGTTKVATVNRAWAQNPGVGTDFVILPSVDAGVYRLLGLLHHNSRLDNTTYAANGLMTSARLRVFATAAACTAAVDGAADGADGEVQRYTLTTVDEGDGRVLSFRITEAL